MDVDGESAFDSLDFDIVFGALNQDDRRMYDSWVHTWLVMVGYGGIPKNGVKPLNLKVGYSLQQLRNHINFDFTIQKTNSAADGWVMHIFDKTTKERIADL